jgi:hypothetical protein
MNFATASPSLTFADAARRLGLSSSGLHHQLRGERPVSRQTELLLEGLEDRRRSLIVSAEPAPFRHRRIPPVPAPTEIITNLDLHAHDVHYAIRDLDQFAKRHDRVGPEIEEFVRPLRLRLLQRLEKTEVVRLDNTRRGRQAKLKIID